MNKEAIRLIDRLYKDLYLDEQVIHHGNGNKYDKFNNIKSYIEKLESIHNKIQDKERHIELLKKLYYEKYVIKKEDIPESYYKHQQEIALERGYGHIEITEEQRNELQNEVINNQKASIDTWLDYFLSEDASVYPFWAKYWAFQGMLKLGTYDKEKGTFNKRDKNTVSPFVDLNREALAMSIDLMIKLMNKEELEDKELENLVKTGSFQKIYTHILTKVLKDNKNITKRNIGKWIKYDQGSDHLPLVQSLQGYNTGWCTAGESTAKSQLSNGDFYVYYTLDENDEYKVPRIAIRMEYGKIGEIRGIAKDQNLEPEMEEVVEEKIKDFPDKEEYYKKVNDMKLLTHIYKKNQVKRELTKEEIIFLYEIYESIIGFGYDKDPRILEIKKTRDCRDDLKLIFDGSIQNFERDLNLNILTNAEGLVLPRSIKGSLFLNVITNAKGLVLPQKISGDLYLGSITSAEGLVLPQNIEGTLYLKSIVDSKGLVLPQNVGRQLILSSLKSAEGLELPQNIGRDLDLSGLISAKGLVLPQNIGRNLYLDSLINAEGLVLPQKMSGDLYLSSLTSAEGLVLPQNIGNLYLKSLTSAEGLVLPQNIGNLYLNSLTSAEGLVFPKNIDGELNLTSLTSVQGLELPKSIGGNLYLDSLTSAEGLVLPQKIGGIFLNSLTSAEGLVLPQNIRGSLYLSSLTSAKGLELPQKIDADLDLSSLTSAEGLVLPEGIWALKLSSLTSVEDLVLPHNIYEYLDLRSLTSPEGLIIPEPLTYIIYMAGFEITPENVDEYRINKKSDKSI